MSAATIAMAVPPSEPHPSSAQAARQNYCPSCGFAIPPAADDMAAASALLEAQRKIADLEAQVRLLNQKAAAAVDRWADYEDELAQLRRESQSQSSPVSPKHQTTKQHQHPTIDVPSPPPSATLPPPQTLGSDLVQQQQQQQTLQPPPSPQRSSFSRLSALLTRKSVPNLQAQQQQQAPPVPKTTNVTPAHSRTNSPTQNIPARPSTTSADTATSKEAAELAAALKREQSLRLAAERRVDDTSREVEELSVSLFEQANEMVAEERRARARLEERVEILEKRDVEKRRRLDRLEMALKRIERVRGVLDKKEEPGNDEMEGGKEKEGEEKRKMSL